MADVLSGLLQGVDRGFSNGLNLYKTVQDEARQKRLEQYQLKRDAIADQRYEQTWENNLQRQRVADEQWGKTHDENVRKTNATIEHNKGMLGVAQQNARTSAGNLSLAQQRQQYVMDEDQRIRRVDNAQKLLGASLLDDDGAYITDPAVYAARANQNPQVLKATIDLAVEHGLLDPKRAAGYTGAQLVPTPQGLALRVAGVDAKGNPIKPGGGILSQNGTSDPDDPYVLVGIDQLRTLADPKFVAAQRSNALARDLSASVSAEYDNIIQATLGDWDKQINSVVRDINAGEAKLAELQAERAKLPDTVILADPRGDGMNVRGNPRAMKIDKEIASLSSALRDQEQKVRVFMERGQEVVPFYDKLKANVLSGIATDHRIQGENYYANQQTLSAGAPKAQALRLAESEKAFEAFRKEVPGQVTKAPNAKGEGGTKGTVNQINIMLETLSPEMRRRIGGDPRYRALARDLLEKAGRTGITGDLGMMMEAAEAGANMDVYMEQMNSPQLMKHSLAEREQFALEVARRAAAHPDKSPDTIAGELMREMNAR